MLQGPAKRSYKGVIVEKKKKTQSAMSFHNDTQRNSHSKTHKVRSHRLLPPNRPILPHRQHRLHLPLQPPIPPLSARSLRHLLRQEMIYL